MTPAHDPSPTRGLEFAYEIQLRLFEQLTTIGVAGTGVIITLMGTVLKDGGIIGWIAVVWFALAAVLAIAGQFSMTQLTDFSQPPPKRLRLLAQVAVFLIGMGMGALGGSVLLTGV